MKKLSRYSSFNILNNWELRSRNWKVKVLPLTSYFLLLTFYFLGCAPKVAPPPLYKDTALSLLEVIKIAQGDINTLKAVVGINIEKGNKLYSYVDASLLLKKPNWLHMRLYKFGIMVGNFFIKDNIVYAISGKGSDKFKEFGRELYYSVFWWEDLENALMHKEGNQYIIKAENKEIRLNSATLLPESQEITTHNKRIHITYAEPKQNSGLWYPSMVKIEIGLYRFIVKVDDLFINPPLGENDFKTPEGNDKL